jgi:hypothetical protein
MLSDNRAVCRQPIPHDRTDAYQADAAGMCSSTFAWPQLLHELFIKAPYASA